jgi:hypothetical protein
MPSQVPAVLRSPLTPRAARRVVAVATSLVLAAAVAMVAGAPVAGEVVPGPLARPARALVGAGAWLWAHGGAVRALRPAVAIAAGLWIVWSWRSPKRRAGAGWLLAALGLAYVAQTFLLERRFALAVSLYLLGGAVWVARGARAPERPAAAWMEAGGILAALGALMVSGLWLLDVRPDLGYDELGFAMAARMQLGQYPPGRILVYAFSRFQAQAIPLALDALALEHLDHGILSLRLVSLAGVFLAVGLLAWTLRTRVESRLIPWTVALAVSCPLLLAYGRLAEYVAWSLPHAVLVFALLLRLRDRWDRAPAVALGVVLGLGIYLYQLSWLMPVFVGATVLLWGHLRRPAVVASRVALVAVPALLTALPAFVFLESGLGEVAGQTFDRAIWRDEPEPTGRQAMALVLAPGGVPREAVEPVADELASRGLTTTWGADRREPTLMVQGERGAVSTAADALESRGWTTLMSVRLERRSVVRNLQSVVAQLLWRPGIDRMRHTMVAVPMLSPLVAPLLLVGIVEALRRRDPVLRALVVWVVGGALLPAVASGVAPRRCVLMLPFAYALMALPLADVLACTAAGGGPWRRRAAGGAALAFVVAVMATHAHLYHRYWADWPDEPFGTLALAKAVEALPPDDTVVLPALTPRQGSDLALYLKVLYRQRPAHRLVPLAAARPEAEELRRVACRERLPIAWVLRPTPDGRATAATLASHGPHETELRPPYTVVRLLARDHAACDGEPGFSAP